MVDGLIRFLSWAPQAAIGAATVFAAVRFAADMGDASTVLFARGLAWLCEAVAGSEGKKRRCRNTTTS